MKLLKSAKFIGALVLAAAVTFSGGMVTNGFAASVDPAQEEWRKVEEAKEKETQEYLRQADNRIDEAAVKKSAADKGIQLKSVPAEGGIAVPSEGVTAAKKDPRVGDPGDVLVTLDAKTSGWNHGHAGIVVSRKKSNKFTVEAFPEKGVGYHANDWKSRYKTVKGLHVKGAKAKHYNGAQKWAQAQVGKPYSLTAGKNQTSKYYCSLLVWKAWRLQGWDIDHDGGYYVFPIDILKDAHTVAFYSKGF